MATQAVEAPFKDYCLILQVHPEADADMVETAYWHLARRYSEEAAVNPNAKAKLDELNEAYSALGAPSRRIKYLARRDEVLGEGTLPVAPPPPHDPPPLAVMEKQLPTIAPREYVGKRIDISFDFGLQAVTSATWQHALVVGILISAAVGVLATTPYTIWALGLLLLAVISSVGPIARELAKLSDVLPRNWRSRAQ